MHLINNIQAELNFLRTQNVIASNGPNIKIDANTINFSNVGIVYVPEPTPAKFHESNALVRLIMGAYGSGKTSACIADIILRAARMPPCVDDVRHVRIAVIRNTYAELETTTLNSWDNWTLGFETVERHKKPIIYLLQRCNDGLGIIELEIIFLALDREDDVKKIKSLELTYAFINEACEIPFSLVSHILGRTGRYPTQQMLQGKRFWHGVLMDTNPPDSDHAIYRVFEVEKPESYEIFHQPPAILRLEDGRHIINPAAENISHHQQGADYYLNMIKGATIEFVNVYAMGKYGLVMSGKVVYPAYNDDLHSTTDIELSKQEDVIVGWDFGVLTSAALICQIISCQIRVVKEFIVEREGFKEFAEHIVLPYLRTNFPQCKIVSTADPSGVAANYTNLLSGIQILNDLGLVTIPALTNSIDQRIESVQTVLSRLIGGKAAIIIDRSNCSNLRKGFLGKYCYKRIRVLNEEKYRDVPDKTHPFSDIHDCLQYICLYLVGGIMRDKKDTNFKAQDWQLPSTNNNWQWRQ